MPETPKITGPKPKRKYVGYIAADAAKAVETVQRRGGIAWLVESRDWARGGEWWGWDMLYFTKAQLARHLAKHDAKGKA